MDADVTREQVLGFRVRAQQLDRERGTLADTAVLHLGVQDSGPEGAAWALALRGVGVPDLPADALALAWTVRGAPHAYRREDLGSVAVAVQPYPDADAGKRIYDASKPLKAAGIGNLEALDVVAATLRQAVAAPTVKGEASRLLAERLPEPYLRYCRPCDATHLHEMPFRLAALRAGLELQAATSPPVLQPVPQMAAPHDAERFDLVRGYLRLLGPATPKHVSDYLDAPVADIKARWPADAVEVAVAGQARWVLEPDGLAAGPPTLVRLLGPFDLFLQARDRALLVPDAAHAKALFPVLGRPGGVLVDGEVVGTWRARRAGAALDLAVQLWSQPRDVRGELGEQAERLAAHRTLRLGKLEVSG